MFKQSLLVLALAIPLTSHSITVWEANNLIENIIKNSTFEESDLGPIKYFISQKIHHTDEINNLETILKQAEQTLQAQQKNNCPSNTCLAVLDAGNSIIGIFIGSLGLAAVQVGAINIVATTIKLWINHVTHVNALGKYDYYKVHDHQIIKEIGANKALLDSADAHSEQNQLNGIKACIMVAGIGAVVGTIAYAINQKIQNTFKKRALVEVKLQGIRNLIEHLRYEQGKACAQSIS